MNLENNPTVDDLRTLLSVQNDDAGHHIVWVDASGNVHVDTVPDDDSPVGFARSLPNVKLRLETLQAGNGYTGPEAAKDDDWVKRLFNGLVENWPSAKTAKTPCYRDMY